MKINQITEANFGPAATAAIQQGKSPSEVAYADTQDKNNIAKGLKIQQQVAQGQDPTLTSAGNAAKAAGNTTVEEGAGNIGAQIKAVYKKIYDAGDDAVEFAYYDSPIFAQYWDEYEGDLDSIIAEIDPTELQVILDELTSAAEDQGVSEGERGLGRPTTGTWDPTSGKVGRVEKTSTGIRHHADPGRYGGTEPDRDDDRLLSRAQLHRLDKATEPEVDEGKKKSEPPEADYGDDYQDMVARVKKLAGMGPLKTVYDPQKRVYKNVPVAVQPAQQPKK